MDWGPGVGIYWGRILLSFAGLLLICYPRESPSADQPTWESADYTEKPSECEMQFLLSLFLSKITIPRVLVAKMRRNDKADALACPCRLSRFFFKMGRIWKPSHGLGRTKSRPWLCSFLLLLFNWSHWEAAQAVINTDQKIRIWNLHRGTRFKCPASSWRIHVNYQASPFGNFTNWRIFKCQRWLSVRELWLSTRRR